MRKILRIVRLTAGQARVLFGSKRARRLFASRGVISIALGLCLIAALPPRPLLHQEVQTEASVLAPDYISDHDRERYQNLFALGARADRAMIDATLAQIDNKVIVGHILADRIVDGSYAATKDDLIAWLTRYSDHPQAQQIRTLAALKGVDVVAFKTNGEILRGDGYIDHVGKKPMPDSWYQALNLWKEGKFASAAAIFSKIGENENLSGWQRAAGYYWASRCDAKLGNRRIASAELKHAAEFSTTFYGLLALRERGEMVSLAAAAPGVPSDIHSNAHAVRARALASIGELARAETELRRLSADLDKSDRAAVVTLAAELNLANLQVRLSTLKTLSDDEEIFAAYPMPHWLTAAQSSIDPALVLAIARQESVFREEVTSQAGAVGMMQMLPSTASMMMSGLKRGGMSLASTQSDTLPMAEQLTNPQLNIRLGAEYVRHLQAQPYIGNNLVKTLAAYNAGPGSVSTWQKTSAAKIVDPLLYIESIPYKETRNYVMQVMAHYWVYQSLMGEYPVSLAALAQGNWPTV